MFEKGILKYSELKDIEIAMLQKENINCRSYRVLERIKKSMNQFNTNKMIKAILINLEDFQTLEIKYKEKIKKTMQ